MFLVAAVLLSAHVLLAEGGCPTCDSWAGTPEVICGSDGVTYQSHCELLVSLCQQDIITMGDGVDINTIPVTMIVAGYIANTGACSDDGGSGNCPDCVGVPDSAVCDSSLTEFNNTCLLVKELCALSIVAFDDGVDFSGWTNDDYYGRCQTYVQWMGPCSGPCEAGKYSASGNYPCQSCSPGSYQDITGQSACKPCARGFYQALGGGISCDACPASQTTTQTGATSPSDCKDGCTAGTISDSGLEPCQACPAGSYQGSAGASACINCPTGGYSPSAGAAACLTCSSGSYSATTGSTSCSNCTAGSAAPSSGSSSCLQCGPGTFSTVDGASSCDLCVKGSYSDQQQNTACLDCSAGHYTDEEGSGVCKLCPIGSYSSSSAAESCTLCSAGTFSDVAGATACQTCPAGSISSIGAGACSSCAAGTHSSNNECEDCPANTYSAGGADTCTPCPSDQISNPGSDKCLDCGEGSYVNPAGNCDQCPPGFYSDTIGASECTACPEGEYSATMGSTSCTKCAPGHFSNSSDATSCTMCHPGTYNDQFGESACTECALGLYAPSAASTYCFPCHPGKFGNETGAFKCHDCDIGSFQTQSGQEQCDLCPAGKYNTVTGATYCMDCSPGMFNNQSGADHCDNCARGEYAVNPGSVACDDCPKGTYNMYERSAHCTDCPPGTYANSTGNIVCHDCPEGHHNSDSSGHTCNPCPKGTHADVGAHHCTNCQTGHFADEEGSAMCQPCQAGSSAWQTGQETCTPCSAGRYAANNGTTHCSVCDTGSFSPEGSAVCTPCPIGHYGDTTEADSCSVCPAGSYAALTGSTACDACSVGEYSAITGAAECNDCVAGHYSDSTGSTACKACPAGKTSDPGAGSCSACTPGTYSDTQGAGQCTQCDAGSYSDSAGATSCSLCPIGSYSPAGATSCSSCPAGSYANSTGTDQCTLCPAGTYQSQEGQGSCVPCTQGYYNALTGQTVCTACAAGSYSDSAGQVSCSACRAGSYASSTGTAQCALCPRGQYSAAQGSTACASCPAGSVANVEGMTACVTCGPGSYSAGTGGVTCTQCAAGSFSSASAAASCSLCAAGSYAETIGSSSCTLCPIGTYADTAGTVTCPQCQNSINTDVGQTECVQCDKGTRPNDDGSECEPYNIARDKPASQSTTHSGDGNPNKATDGDTGTQFFTNGCAHTISQTNPWWKVDLQDTFPVEEVIVVNRGDCCADRIDGFRIHIGDTGTSSDPVCGAALLSADFISSVKHVKCELTGRYISVHHPSNSGGKVLTICELEAYTVDLDRPCPSGYFSATGFRPCKPCRAGSYIAGGQCNVCERGTYSSQDQSTECFDCPAGHTTYKPNTSQCYGPLLEGNYYGYWLKRYVQVPDLGYVKDRLQGFKATVGDWELFDKDYYRLKKGTVTHGQTIPYTTATVNSIKPIITNKFCYAPRDLGKSYTGYRSTTVSGKTCQNWSSQSPHTHTYGTCGWGSSLPNKYLGGTTLGQRTTKSLSNPAWMGGRSFAENVALCMTDCENTAGCTGVNFSPTNWNHQECFLKSGTETVTSSKWSTNMCTRSVGNHNLCRNPDNASEGPWCYTTDPATRWETCDVPKCSNDVDCYLEEGNSYMGVVATTETGQTCDNWAGTSDNYCKNVDGSGMHKPWCYKSGQKKACSVDKCKQDCGNPASGLWGRFLAKNSGLCMEVVGTHSRIGENVQLHHCQVPHKSSTDHVWKMNSNGYIINKKTQYCLNVLGYRSKDPDTNLNMWTCQYNMNTDQKWEVEWSSFDDCAFRLKNKDTHQCVDAPGESSTNTNTNMQQYYCEDRTTSDQWFYFIPTQDRLCDYTYYNNKYLAGSITGETYYASLGSAQQACSRLGEMCGGVTRTSNGLHQLRKGDSPTQSPYGEKSWLKGDCADTHYNYYEQSFA